MQAVRQWVFVFVLAAAMFGPGPFKPITAHSAAADTASSNKAVLALHANVLQGSSLLTMTGPTACPATGCVTGQRVSMHFEFDFPNALADPSGLQPPNSNVRICIYATTNWNIVPDTKTADQGENTGASYTVPTDSFCGQLTGYSLIRDRVASIPLNTPNDALDFSFRFGIVQLAAGKTDTPGNVIARMFPLTAPNTWAQTAFADARTSNISAAPLTGASAYVGSDSEACGDNNNCYVNSADDGDGGLGTGIKDAIDLPAISTINILGNYPIKTQTVLVNRKLTITGSDGATITYHGPSDAQSCGKFMLSFSTTVTVRGLYINDGACTTTGRNLIEVNSPTAKPAGDVVLIESNDLTVTGGANAVTIRGGTTDWIVMRFNQVSVRAGLGVLAENGPAPLEVVANNFSINKNGSTPIPTNGPMIQCASGATALAGHRKANHNYWEAAAPDPNAAHCVYDPAKRMGSPIAHNVDAPGVRATMVAVTDKKAYAAQFDNMIAYNYSGSGGSPFNLYIVDYGYMPLISYNGQELNDAPFSFSGGGAGPSPCSNYWDVFLPDGLVVNNKLELYFKYFNNTSAPKCVDTINLVQYCSQKTAPEKYPLLWLDPSSKSVTGWWNPVGATPTNLTSVNGQVTTCNTDAQEIQVSLSSKNRPALSDLGYTPFVVGISVIKSFSLYTSSQTVTINWATNIEPDVYNFSILRGTTSDNLTSVSNLANLPRYGSLTTGYASYSKQDTGLTNGTLYYYRLKVNRADGSAYYSNIEHITVNVATPIPPTLTPTRTPVRPSSTPPFTPVPTRLPTQPFKSPTPLPTFTTSPTPFALPTLADTSEPETSGSAATLTAIAVASASTETPTLTPEALGSGTPELTLSAVPPEAVAGTSATSLHPWLSLLLGLLAGLVLVAGIGGWWYRTTRM